jgi:hypothetical protein
MKKRKFAAGGYLPNYGDEQPQNPFGPSVINPTGQDMGLPSMGNPYDPYEQGYRHGGKVKMRKKMADGGMSETTSTPPVLRGQARRIAEHPDAATIRANAQAFQPLGLARRQYGSTSPEYGNYLAFYRMEQQKYKDAMGGGSLLPRKDVSVGTYTAGTYNPATDYIAIGQQQDAAARAAKKAAKEKFEAARRPAMKMAKGGMASSASKRGDGIAQRGKTKCKMR